MEAATAADLTQASEIPVRYITLGSAAKGYGPGQGLPASPWPGPGGPSPTQNVGSGPNHQKWPNWVQNPPFGLKLGPEACQDRSGAFGMGLTHSKGPSPAKKVKKCARAAPGLAGRCITLGSAAKGYVSDLTVL